MAPQRDPPQARSSMAQLTHYKAIFAPASSSDRRRAFEDYWAYLLRRDGALHEEAQALEHKTGYYQSLQARPIHARQLLTSAQSMAALSDLLATQHRPRADRRLLALTLIYKFASHEAAGILIDEREGEQTPDS